jgi:hypothetical protein
MNSDFPLPNAYFGQPLPLDGRRKLKSLLSRVLLLFVLALHGYGLIAMLLQAWLGDQWFNWSARIYMLGMVGFIPTTVFYRRSIRTQQWLAGDVIPVVVIPSSDSLLKAILVGLPLFVLGLVGGICFTFCRAFELAGRKPWQVRYMLNGKVRSMKVWLPEDEMAQVLPGSVIWLTRPKFFVPPRLVGRTYGVDECELVPQDVQEWLVGALQVADKRRN